MLDAVRRRKVGPQTMVQSLLAGLDMQLRGSDVTALMEIAAEAGKGRREEALTDLGQRLFRERVAGTVYPEARAVVKAHQRKGHTVALASSATLFQAGPLAADLGIEHVLCTKIEVEDGRLTGRLCGPVLWGRNKADAVAAFAADSGSQAGRELRLRQRRRRHRVPRDRRAGPAAQPRARPGPGGRRAGLAGPPVRAPGPAGDRPRRPHRGRPGRRGHDARGRRRHRSPQPQPPDGGQSRGQRRRRRWPWAWPVSA